MAAAQSASNGQTTEDFANRVIGQLLSLAVPHQSGGLAQSIAGRLGAEAPEEEDEYAEAMRTLGLASAGGMGEGAPDLTHAALRRRSPGTAGPDGESAVASESAESVDSAPEGGSGESGEGGGQGQNVDVDKLAELVYRLMRDDLSLEMERTKRL